MLFALIVQSQKKRVEVNNVRVPTKNNLDARCQITTKFRRKNNTLSKH